MTTFGYNDSRILLTSLGTFWSSFYTEKDLITKTLAGLQIDFENEYFRFCENVLALSLKDIPVFNRQRWKNIILLESQINVNTGGFLKYGEGATYGNGKLYGGLIKNGGISFFLEGIKNLNGFVVNRIYNPSLILTENKDFFFSNEVIQFKENLFDNPLIAQRNIIDENNNIVDREISLWITEIETDRQYLFKNYGSLFNLFDESSESYKILLRSLLAIHMNGPKLRYAEGFVNALLGLPIIIEKEEIIRHIIKENGKKRIITDHHSYLIDDTNINPEVFIGNTLKEFTPIHSIITFLDNENTPDWWINKKFLSVPQNLLDETFLSDMVVQNKTIEVPNKIGQTFNFEFTGKVTPDKKEEMKNTTLKIGMKGFKIGEPFVRINFLDFVAGLIKDNLFAISYDPTKVNGDRVKLLLNNFFANLIPVHCAFIVLTEMQIEDEYDLGSNTVDEVTLDDGKVITEEYEFDNDYNDGFFGLPKIGFFKIGEANVLAHPEEVAPQPVQIGRKHMHKKPFLRLVKNGKCK